MCKSLNAGGQLSVSVDSITTLQCATDEHITIRYAVRRNSFITIDIGEKNDFYQIYAIQINRVRIKYF